MAHKSAAFGLKWRSTPTDIRNHYAKRAAQYDKEVSDEISYVAPRKAAETLATWIKNLDARILDAGAGTGLVGECLHQLGYNNLDALDICPEMTEIAKKKGVYKNMYVDILGGPNPTQLPSNQYDAVVCVGVIEQPGPAALDELIRITKHNGIIVFTLRVDVAEDPDEVDFKQKLPTIESENKVMLLSKPRTAYHDATDCFMYSYKVLKEAE